jgi:hypothetical protein
MSARPSPSSVRRGTRLVLVLSVLLISSCSSSKGLRPVRGKVLYRGNPIQGALVVFHPKGSDDINTQRPSGLTASDGSFSLSTGREEGAAEGDYVVTVVWLKEPEPPAGKKFISTEPGGADPVDQLQGRYADRTRSKLAARVDKKESNNLEPFRLE